MTTPTATVSTEEYERIALAEPERRWELHDGRPREKPTMSMGHDWTQSALLEQLMRQLDRQRYWVQFAARLRRGERTYYIPDISVVPVAQLGQEQIDWRRLNAYATPLSLVIEIWSPSTGDYDIDEKLPEYQQRGDEEIWRLHPFERTLRVWRRQPDGTYTETLHRGGTVTLAPLPHVTIDLEAVFPPQ